MDDKTKRYLELLERQNVSIAAYETEQKNKIETGEDAVRLQREAERREKWGQLRAREHPSRHPSRIYRTFG